MKEKNTMKRLIFIATVLLSALLFGSVKESFSQTKHIQFKGIPVDGPLTSFVSELNKQGYTLSSIEDGKAFLTGKFAGYPDCMIGVASSKGTVWKVIVIFNDEDSWVNILSKYQEFKQSFQLKYNTTPDSVESLDDFYSQGGLIYHGFKEEKNVWVSLFSVPGGNVLLEIGPGASYGRLCLVISYQDEINAEIRKSATMDDI